MYDQGGVGCVVLVKYMIRYHQVVGLYSVDGVFDRSTIDYHTK